MAGLTGLAASVEAHGPGHGGPEQTYVIQVLPGQHLPRLWRQVAPWPPAGVILGHRHPTPGALETPWHYQPTLDCTPPYCLPSYHRHRLQTPTGPLMPLELILQRLARLEYYAFDGFVLDGPDCWIGAWNRYGQPVRLIVNAGNGQIRRLVILPQF